MCGILGVALTRRIAEDSSIATAIGRLDHRGPDGEGIWWSADRRVALAHRRLSIIDTSALGNQPMTDAATGTTISFNGEIYNFQELRAELSAKGHVFRSRSDTEVVLAAYREWGMDCVSRFNGMFAFGVFDETKQRLFLARDRAGEKPLFYHATRTGLRFASELKALLADPSFPRTADVQALDYFLAVGYVPGDRTFLRGVSKLPPAHALSFDATTGATRIWRYWSPPQPRWEEHPRAVGDLLDELEELLADAVKRQMVSDVPLGVLLSGGVDSSLVVAMAARTKSAVRTFTVRFPGHAEYDETDHARLIARAFGTTHTELEADQASPELLPVLARQFDEPIADSSMLPTYLVSRLVRNHCTVALGGDGGDELFGGYPQYRRLLWLYGRTKRIPRALREFVGEVGVRLTSERLRGRNWLAALGTDFDCEVPPVDALFDPVWRNRLLPGRSDWRQTDRARRERVPISPDLLDRMTRMDFQNFLAEDILVKVDRASMLASLEVRAPFLDHRIIEFAFAEIPSSLKATSGALKVLLKALSRRVLPPEFDYTRKQGFSIPLDKWLRGGEWADSFRAVLDCEDGWFSRPAVRRLLDEQERGVRHGEQLYALLMVELWRRQYGIDLG